MADNEPTFHAEALSRDQLLFWLNDRVGEQLVVIVMTEKEVGWAVAFEGKLAHWTDDGFDPANETHDISGMYLVGDGRINVTELGQAMAVRGFTLFATWVFGTPRDELVFVEVDDHVKLALFVKV
jgi:hypothetical protein